MGKISLTTPSESKDMRILALLLLVGVALASPLPEDRDSDIPINEGFEEVAAPIVYELVEKRSNNFQPWNGKRNYEPWRGKRDGSTDKGYQPWLGRRKKDDQTNDYMWSRLKKNQGTGYQWSRMRKNQYQWGRL